MPLDDPTDLLPPANAVAHPASRPGALAGLPSLAGLPGLPGAGGEEASDLRPSILTPYWQAIVSRKWIVLTTTLLGGICGLAYMVPQPVVYTARTQIELQGINESFLGFNQLDPNAGTGMYSVMGTALATQIQLMTSDGLRQRTRERMAPDTLPFTPPAADMFSPLRERFGSMPADPLDFVRQSVDMAVSTVSARPLNETRIIEIRCDSLSPEVAAGFLNALTNEFAEQSGENRSRTSQKTSQYLATKLQEQKQKLEDSEKALQDYVRNSGLLFINPDNTLADSKLRQLQGELASMQSERIAKQSRYEMALNSPPDTLPDILDDGSLRTYQQNISDLRRQLAELNSVYTPEHYKVKKLQGQLDEIESALRKQRENILRRIRNEFEAAQRREKLLTEAYTAQSQTVNSQSEKAVQYGILRREAENNRGLYNSMLQQLSQAGVSSAVPVSNVRVVDPAFPPGRPSRPDPLLFLGSGLVTGMLAGIAFCVLREFTDSSFRGPGHTSGLLNVPELGVVPTALKVRPRRRWTKWIKRPSLPARLAFLRFGRKPRPKPLMLEPGQKVETAAWFQRSSVLAESFRVSVASLMLGGEERRPRVMVLTSPRAGDGKTTVACNLAAAFAEIHNRIVIVDADVRRPRLQDVFETPNTWGLADLIQERTPVAEYDLDTILRPTQIPGLSVLPSGPSTLNVTSLYYSPRMHELVERLRREFDVVIIDTPPILQFSDARVIGSLADGVILVLRAGETDRAAAFAARQRLAEDGTPVLGSILNSWDPNKMRHSHYGDYARPY